MLVVSVSVALILAAFMLIALAYRAFAAPPRPAGPPSEDAYRVLRLDNALALPYPLDNLFRGWVECTGRGHHKALDIGGVGPDYGLGTPIRAMAKARILEVGLPQDDPARFGKPLVDATRVTRSGEDLPAWREIEGYGKVYFFTEDYGAHRSGGTLTMRVLEGVLEGHELRYLHIAAVAPGLKVGATVSAGEVVALMGGTAVLDAPPHLHLDIVTPDGRSLDVGRILGIGATRVPCGADQGLTAAIRARYSKAARILMAALRKRRDEEGEGEPVRVCGPRVVNEDFDGGALRSQRYVVEPVLDPEGKPLPFDISVARTSGKQWSPRVQLEDLKGKALFTGTLATAKAKKRFTFKSESSGKRGEARVTITPKSTEAIVVRVLSWATHKRAYRDAKFRLTIDRPCPEN
jgi:hypothetical protein